MMAPTMLLGTYILSVLVALLLELVLGRPAAASPRCGWVMMPVLPARDKAARSIENGLIIPPGSIGSPLAAAPMPSCIWIPLLISVCPLHNPLTLCWRSVSKLCLSFCEMRLSAWDTASMVGPLTVMVLSRLSATSYGDSTPISLRLCCSLKNLLNDWWAWLGKGLTWTRRCWCLSPAWSSWSWRPASRSDDPPAGSLHAASAPLRRSIWIIILVDLICCCFSLPMLYCQKKESLFERVPKIMQHQNSSFISVFYRRFVKDIATKCDRNWW